jgi:hypothetical protein
MTLDELQLEVEKDMKIDDFQLDIESLKTPNLHAKYLQYYNRFSLLHKKAKSDYKVMVREKWEYYMGKSDPEVYRDKPFDHKILKQDVPMYLDADPDLVELQQKAEYYEQHVVFLEQILRSLNNRTFQIKNAIEWKKFVEGAI